LVQTGERTFVHTNGTSSITFTGIMHKGAKVDHKLVGAGLFFDVELKIMQS